VVGALVAVNAWGDVTDPKTGEIIAGLRSGKLGLLQIGKKGQTFANTQAMMKSPAGRGLLSLTARTNTIIGVVATNAALTKAQTTKVAQMAQDGLARTIHPAHTMLDGDTIFALSTGTRKVDVSTVGAFAAEAMAEAIIRGVRAAKSAGGVPGLGQ
jgi:L-aminopeptidase/D-esterase-like protein